MGHDNYKEIQQIVVPNGGELLITVGRSETRWSGSGIEVSEVSRPFITSLSIVPNGGEPQRNHHTHLLELPHSETIPFRFSDYHGTTLTSIPLPLRLVSLRPTVIKD